MLRMVNKSWKDAKNLDIIWKQLVVQLCMVEGSTPTASWE